MSKSEMEMNARLFHIDNMGKENEKMSKVMTIKTEHSTTEVHLLSPGENFPGFGGSKRGLVVGKTPSLITRQYDHKSGSMNDIEHALNSKTAWDKIKTLISKAESVE